MAKEQLRQLHQVCLHRRGHDIRQTPFFEKERCQQSSTDVVTRRRAETFFQGKPEELEDVAEIPRKLNVSNRAVQWQHHIRHPPAWAVKRDNKKHAIYFGDETATTTPMSGRCSTVLAPRTVNHQCRPATSCRAFCRFAVCYLANTGFQTWSHLSSSCFKTSLHNTHPVHLPLELGRRRAL